MLRCAWDLSNVSIAKRIPEVNGPFVHEQRALERAEVGGRWFPERFDGHFVGSLVCIDPPEAVRPTAAGVEELNLEDASVGRRHDPVPSDRHDLATVIATNEGDRRCDHGNKNCD